MQTKARMEMRRPQGAAHFRAWADLPSTHTAQRSGKNTNDGDGRGTTMP
jgi:hypothetical protein